MNQATMDKVLALLNGAVTVDAAGAITVQDEAALRGAPIDKLAALSALGDSGEQAVARLLIWEGARALGIYPATIHDLYIARGEGKTRNDCVIPAMNLRALTYDMAQAIFRAANARDVGSMLFEIARSEMGYTSQRPAEYVSSILAGAIKEGYRGPVFIQGDHFQVSPARFKSDADTELQTLRDLMIESMDAGFYNIDIDTSTLVDLDKESLSEQQYLNYHLCAEFTQFVRANQPAGIMISLGGEIGEVGLANSTPEELHAFMKGFDAELDDGTTGLSKISVQTGTSHGGVVLPDGSIAEVAVDFDVLKELSDLARDDYGMAGAVQHGASTLPANAFNQFSKATACEVHLATGFQNMMYDHAAFPAALRDKMYAYLDENFGGSRKPGQTDEQFYYNERKRAIGAFKGELWSMDDDVRAALRQTWEDQFGFLFEQLNVVNTREMTLEHTKIVEIHKTLADFGVGKTVEEDVSDLAD